MEKQPNIVLFGFMGSGKSAVGKCLAETLGFPLLDMDTMIEERQGKSIARIFAEDGEAVFRGLERELVRELASRSGTVISTGGGVVLDADNIRDYAANGLCVCLYADPETILSRTATDTNRPLLEVEDRRRQIVELLEKRRDLYASVPHTIDTTGLSVRDVADRILALYHNEVRSIAKQTSQMLKAQT